MADATYNRGTSANVIVGAAAIFVAEQEAPLPIPASDRSYKETLSEPAQVTAGWRNVGYTSNGLELQFAPEFGEVQVDQLLDVAKMFKSGMTVTLNTSFAEATLDNLAIAIAQSAPRIAGTTESTEIPIEETDKVTVSAGNWETGSKVLDLTSGQLGECPVERKLVAVGPGIGECEDSSVLDADINERIYTAFRVLSIDSVTASHKRDEASVYDVSFRLLPNKGGLYGQIVDRTWTVSLTTPK